MHIFLFSLEIDHFVSFVSLLSVFLRSAYDLVGSVGGWFGLVCKAGRIPIRLYFHASAVSID